ncbi:hypothetical protein P9600_gp38 [Escherichia phage vB_EcoD_Opt212]|uniref:Uncharacterized protein n=1 Tax=Escherichia phage vB_EcoD_Opt212 TaxID=2906743 RepID=A0AAE9CGT9_9CAUD|nr:hypothetical protein P9600_gp38 [Escherichia phage vB_EcoD_Opt212]UHS64819.1 hypothetical protein OPT212_38 [Escherichia phage vB_EcoD_Opt212]
MNILIVDRSLAVVDQMQKDFCIDPRRDRVHRVLRPEHLLGMDLTGWLVITRRCHFVCNSFTARSARQTLIESLK